VALVILVFSCHPAASPAPVGSVAGAAASPPANSAGLETVSRPQPEPAAQPPGEVVECRATIQHRTIELHLRWDRNVATGMLVTIDGNKASEQPVRAELYKGLVLVSPAASTDANQRIATVQENEVRSIQVGNWNAPWIACE
jgi:hypothetical protein